MLTVSGCSCLKCGSPIPAEDVNVAADSALCRKCGKAFRFSDGVTRAAISSFDPAKVPDGVTFEPQADGLAAEVSTRSSQAWFLVPFVLIWSSLSVAMLYGTQFQHRKFDLFQSVFGLPFLFGSFLLGWQALLSAAGRVLITSNGAEGTIFQGVGALGRKWRFQWADLSSVGEDTRTTGRGGPTRSVRVSFHSGACTDFRFGAILSAERREYVISLLQWQKMRRG